MNKKDLLIKERLQQDRNISEKANRIFEKIKEEYNLENNNEKKVITISLNKFIGIAAATVIVLFVGFNMLAYKMERPNLISSIEALIKKDDEESVDKIAKELFEKAVLAIRDGLYNETDSEDIKEVNGIYYAKTKLKYSELKEKYEEIFTEEALENALAMNAIDVEGIAYGVPKAGPGYIIEDIAVEKINDNNEELTYKAIYTKTFTDGSAKEENICEFKIKKVKENYRIFATNYMNLDEKEQKGEAENIVLDKHIKNEMGVSFNYLKEWKYVDNNKGSGVVSVGLNIPPNEGDIENVIFEISYRVDVEKITPKQCKEEASRFADVKEEGNITIDGQQGYYWVGNKEMEGNYIYKTIYIKVNSLIYEICYGGNTGLYNKYYKTFEKMLDTVEFSDPTYIEEWGAKNYANNSMDSEKVITNKIAKELFKKGSDEIRKLQYSGLIKEEYEVSGTLIEKEVNGRIYIKTNEKYERTEQKYAEIFTDEALENVLATRFVNVDGILYVSYGGATGWDITNVEVEKINEKNGELTYRASYNDVNVDDSISEKRYYCEFKIKEVNGEYKISQIDYLDVDKENNGWNN